VQTTAARVVARFAMQVDSVRVAPVGDDGKSARLAVGLSALEGNIWDGAVAVIGPSPAVAPVAGSGGSGGAEPMMHLSTESGVAAVAWLSPTHVVAGCDSGQVQVCVASCCVP
jgi:hypothetical protein